MLTVRTGRFPVHIHNEKTTRTKTSGGPSLYFVTGDLRYQKHGGGGDLECFVCLFVFWQIDSGCKKVYHHLLTFVEEQNYR